MRPAATGLVSVRRLRAIRDLTKSHAPPEARHAPRSARRPHAPWLVLGEVYHQTRGGRAPDPTWLTITQRGLYTGLMILGAVGTGKGSACMYPYVDQLLRWRSRDADHKLGGLVMEVKRDFCRQAQRMLHRCGGARATASNRGNQSGHHACLIRPCVSPKCLRYSQLCHLENRTSKRTSKRLKTGVNPCRRWSRWCSARVRRSAPS
jgi:hypothetical protein